MVFEAERAKICYDAGELTGVEYQSAGSTDDSLVSAVLLSFELSCWLITANSDDDSINIREVTRSTIAGGSFKDAAGLFPWADALGAHAQWAWVLENQQGYSDGLQFSFAVEGREVCRVQMIAGASSLDVSGATPASSPWRGNLTADGES